MVFCVYVHVVVTGNLPNACREALWHQNLVQNSCLSELAPGVEWKIRVLLLFRFLGNLPAGKFPGAGGLSICYG